MDAAVEQRDDSKILDLANIRVQLIRLEDTITFHLIERVQFPLNAAIYTPGGVTIPNSSLSLLDYILRDTERLHSLVRRYESPDEYPFFPDAVEPAVLKSLRYPKLLHGRKSDVDVTAKIKDAYLTKILPATCKGHCPAGGDGGAGDRGEEEENYGSAATMDVLCLQALSRRIHYGKFVAESKFRSETARFVSLIRAGDRAGLETAITDAAVERMVLERLRLKAKTYGTDPDLTLKPEPESKINVEAVVDMYRDYVIPLTKEVEVEYLMQRLKGTEWE